MSIEIPYRAAGTFDGRSYVVRKADHQLLKEVERNQRFPYVIAPRQSGKSSLLIRTIKTLDRSKYRCAFIDIAPLVIDNYRQFWSDFLAGVAKSGKLNPDALRRKDPEDTFRAWLENSDKKLVVFVDEIDVLSAAPFREQFFSKVRTFFNNRAIDRVFERLQFVLAGSAHPSTLISDPKRSPFNVGVEVELEELTPDQLIALTSHLRGSGARVSPYVPERVFVYTNGSVYLCQLILEQLWGVAMHGKDQITPEDVDKTVQSIVEHARRNIHFENLYRLLSGNRSMLQSFHSLQRREDISDDARMELRLTGISDGRTPLRNELYKRVFTGEGPLSLTRAKGKNTLSGARSQADNGKLKPGDRLGNGTYRLVHKIGQGGFGAVWMAMSEADRRSVAIKVLHSHLAEDDKRRTRFFRGAKEMSMLDHPAIVQVLEPRGEEGGVFYFVMEYVEGHDFRDAVRRQVLAEDKVLPVILRVGDALAHAHERGLIHRDVKPSNILLDATGEPRLTDFDLVRAPEGGTTAGTGSGAVGTFIYSAPEVSRSPKEADARADVYSLAMTAIFGLYGEDLPMDVLRDAGVFIDRELEDCSQAVKDVLKRAVTWNLGQRYPDSSRFCEALKAAWLYDEGPPPMPNEDSLSAGATPLAVTDDDELDDFDVDVTESVEISFEPEPEPARSRPRRPVELVTPINLGEKGTIVGVPIPAGGPRPPGMPVVPMTAPQPARAPEPSGQGSALPPGAVLIHSSEPEPAAKPKPVAPIPVKTPVETPAADATAGNHGNAQAAPTTSDQKPEPDELVIHKEEREGDNLGIMILVFIGAALLLVWVLATKTCDNDTEGTSDTRLAGQTIGDTKTNASGPVPPKTTLDPPNATITPPTTGTPVDPTTPVATAGVDPTVTPATGGSVDPTTPEATGGIVEPTTSEGTGGPVDPTTPEATGGPVDPTTADATTTGPSDPTNPTEVDPTTTPPATTGPEPDTGGDAKTPDPKESRKEKMNKLINQGCALVSKNPRAGMDLLLKAFDMGGGNNPKMRSCMAKGVLAKGDARGALRHYKAALQNSKRNKAALRGAGKAAEQMGKKAGDQATRNRYYREALQFYRRYNLYYPNDPNVTGAINRLEHALQ